MPFAAKVKALVSRVALVVLAAVTIAGCGFDREPAGGPAAAHARPLAPAVAARFADLPVQAVYVPVYSHIYHQENRAFALTATLSIRNTDPDRSLVIRRVRYFDTAGRLVREYVPAPLLLPPMATLEYVVGEQDTAGGSGANFVVEWQADGAISPPVIEAVMVGTSGQQGVSFLSVGQPIQRR